ncbi:MAG: bifunctional diguanylate cyclase/phosphodiesterase, partial [Clostridia bacterium]|nr:bifunctional diguanylate cyclase/phosphodiesterase [Clostridia bacterium]
SMRIIRDYEKKPPHTLGMVFVDINGLKHINDTYGHVYGDRTIVHVAKLLKENMDGYVFRMGGDEFVVLCENISEEDFDDKVKTLRNVFLADGNSDVSIGCTWRSGRMDVDKELVKADALMYAEKQLYYESSFRSGNMTMQQAPAEVMQAIKSGRFIVYFQPQVHIKEKRIIGAEALVRKIREDGVLISPDMFIPFYESRGVIRHVDFFVFETSCIVLKEWRERGISMMNVSVNFSRMTLMEPNLVRNMLEICEKYGIQPESITIEVTESVSRIDHDALRLIINDI